MENFPNQPNSLYYVKLIDIDIKINFSPMGGLQNKENFPLFILVILETLSSLSVKFNFQPKINCV